MNELKAIQKKQIVSIVKYEENMHNELKWQDNYKLKTVTD